MRSIFNIFKPPNARQLAETQMLEAEREYLKHISASEFHAKMAEYHQGVVRRLTGEVK